MPSQPLAPVTAKVAARERDALQRIAQADDRTLSDVVRAAIREYLRRDDEDKRLVLAKRRPKDE